jgi:hypothetical protein
MLLVVDELLDEIREVRLFDFVGDIFWVNFVHCK